MAILTKPTILKRLKDGDLSFAPSLDQFQLHPHSIDLRLGFTFLVPKSWKATPGGRESISLDPFAEETNKFDVIELEKGQFFDLLPGEHVTVSTLESVKIPNDLLAILYPRSSTNRRGLAVDLSGLIDAGYEGQLIIPIRNNTKSQTIRLYPGERICQITLEELEAPVEPRPSRYHKKDIIDGELIGALPKEKEIEIDLIKRGEIMQLKQEHAI
ncbi:MAG TPA: dCTP deaminase [Candidatus Saccharimonadales bacterium]|nr:dCTP deaminase [Candidatus Saccharimonadales bacterium]